MPRYLVTSTDVAEQLLPELVGGKCVQLGQLAKWGVPVPEWFCVTTDAYNLFLEDNNIIHQLDVSQVEHLSFAEAITSSPFPEALEDELTKASIDLLRRSNSKAVAIRSSATIEDGKEAAFAGQFDSFLGIANLESILQSVKACWVSSLSERARHYISRQKNLQQVLMAVIVQEFVPADISGVMFTANPVTKDRNEIVIEAVWGLGELIVGGKVIPDNYLVQITDKSSITNSRITFKIGSKRRYLTWNAEHAKLLELETPAELQRRTTLTEEYLHQLTYFGLHLQSCFNYPLDIEWAIYNERVYFLQARPITTL